MAQGADRVFDEWLVLAAISGDRRAGLRLAQRWQPRLLRTARRLLQQPDLAEEAAQETWLAICRNWRTLNDPARFPAWAFGILHRKCADRIRKAGRERRVIDASAELPDRGLASGAEARLALDEAFAALSPDHRAAAILFFGEGLTLAEIAAATGVPAGTAKSRLFNARLQLKAALSGDDT